MSANARLQRVTNIVVLMMENRSFDHMLGYLKASKPDVDGLTGQEANVGRDGTVYRPRPMRELIPNDPQTVKEGPPHVRKDVLEQLGTFSEGAWKMDGFVRNYEPSTKGHPGVVMGHYDAQHVPTYDFLAREFAVCDRWFCSAPSWTWPNRLFALCGEADGVSGTGTVPLFFKKSFFRQLEASAIGWRCYSHDVTTLSLADARYRFGKSNRPNHFFSFENDFERHCLQQGGLPPVTWIDPNMMVVSANGANDDHPPASIANGQELVRRIYEALRQTPHWPTTLFLITYDEHGGFYDHVSPVRSGDAGHFEWYGPRVPALVVSPLVARGSVCHTTFDHTSIIRTIIERFCPNRLGELPARVRRAEHLGHALSDAEPRVAVPAPALGAANVAAGARLTDLQRARITADYLLELERARAGNAVDAPVPDVSHLERGLIAAEYLASRVGTAGSTGEA